MGQPRAVHRQSQTGSDEALEVEELALREALQLMELGIDAGEAFAHAARNNDILDVARFTAWGMQWVVG